MDISNAAFPGYPSASTKAKVGQKNQSTSSCGVSQAVSDLESKFGYSLTSSQLINDFKGRKKKPEKYAITRPLGSPEPLFLFPTNCYNEALGEILELAIKKANRRSENIRFSTILANTVSREAMAYIVNLHFAAPSLKVLQILCYNIKNSINRGINNDYGSYNVENQKDVEFRGLNPQELLQYFHQYEKNHENKARVSLTSSEQDEPLNKYMAKSQLSSETEQNTFAKYGRAFSTFDTVGFEQFLRGVDPLAQIYAIEKAKKTLLEVQTQPIVEFETTDSRFDKLKYEEIKRDFTRTGGPINSTNFFPGNENDDLPTEMDLPWDLPKESSKSSALTKAPLTGLGIKNGLLKIQEKLESQLIKDSRESLRDVKNTEEGRSIIAKSREIAKNVEILQGENTILSLNIQELSSTSKLLSEEEKSELENLSEKNNGFCDDFLGALEASAAQTPNAYFRESQLVVLQRLMAEQKAAIESRGKELFNLDPSSSGLEKSSLDPAEEGSQTPDSRIEEIKPQ